MPKVMPNHPKGSQSMLETCQHRPKGESKQAQAMPTSAQNGSQDKYLEKASHFFDGDATFNPEGEVKASSRGGVRLSRSVKNCKRVSTGWSYFRDLPSATPTKEKLKH